MSRRAQITMTEAEVSAFLDEQRTVTCATLGPDGWPHLAPLWYVVRDGTVWAWTYAASQKVRNLERDPRATLQVEAGDTYDQLRGVALRCRVVLHRDPAAVAGLGGDIFGRYHGVLTAETMAMVRKQAAKRVALEFTQDGPPATWDHRKLAAGVY
ncbi:MAG TPA: pyridoxamine 5'-phosphate oxidase family protein [Pseudonocardiaceae bacterium]